MPSGFTTTGANSTGSLDYVKAPLFDFTLGRALPPSGSANADDLQDLLTLYLEQCKASEGELYAFGVKFDRNLHKPIDAEFGNTDGLHGVHDIHMNQGNVGAHAHDNGPFRDGGLLLSFADRIMGVFGISDPARPDRRGRGGGARCSAAVADHLASASDGHRHGLSGACPDQPGGQ